MVNSRLRLVVKVPRATDNRLIGNCDKRNMGTAYRLLVVTSLFGLCSCTIEFSIVDSDFDTHWESASDTDTSWQPDSGTEPQTTSDANSGTDTGTVSEEVNDTDMCPNDPAKTEPGICGCGVPDDTCEITPGDLVGDYERGPVENDWHIVNVTLEQGVLAWNNAAGVTWSLALVDDVLTTGSDCPYGVVPVEIKTESGTRPVTGLLFNSELYQRL